MRWSQLFADLESQVDALVSAELAAEVAERTRIESSHVHLADRLRAAKDHPIEVRCVGAGAIKGRIADAGVEWLLIAEAWGAEALIPTAALMSLGGLGRAVAPDVDGTVARRLGLRHVLRGIARDRAPVRIGLTDGSMIAGTIDRIGADHLDVAEHPMGEPRRAAAVRRDVTLPLPAMAVVRRG